MLGGGYAPPHVLRDDRTVVIPIHDRNPVRRTPIVTYAIAAINIVIFLIGPVAGLTSSGSAVEQACTQDAYFRGYGAIPEELIDNEELPPQRTVVVTDRERFECPFEPIDKAPVLSVLTAMFLHGGWLHLLGNMLYLLIFGNNVEDHMGRLRFILFYLVCGYIATYVFALLNQESTQPLVGASGAIAGVLGAYLWLFPRAWVTSLVPFLFFLPFRLPAWIVLGSWFLLQWLYAQGQGVTSGTNVAYVAHVAGFAAGLVITALFFQRPRQPPPERHYAPRRRPPGYPDVG